MSTKMLTSGIYSVGVLNPSLRIFDIIMSTEYGTSYNAYLVKGEEKTALIETVHAEFFDEYLENLSSVTDITKIDYIVMNHCENDHSGSLARLLDLNPNIKVIASMGGARFLKAITNKPLDHTIVAKDGDTIDLGGKTLKFINAPLLHWPDSMFTYVEEDKTLFSCDFLGAHFCEPRVLDNHIIYEEEYAAAFEHYYQAILGPFKQAVLSGLDKIEGLAIDLVCTSHGPVLKRKIRENMAKYRQWSEVINHKNDPKVVSVFYVSAYGCTGALAEAAKSVIEENGFVCKIFDLTYHDLSEIKETIESSDALMFGSPTINRDALKPVWDALAVTDAILNKGKPAAVFGSFGWSGEAVPMIIDRLKGLKLKAFKDGYKVNFVPSSTEIEGMKQYTKEFLEQLV